MAEANYRCLKPDYGVFIFSGGETRRARRPMTRIANDYYHFFAVSDGQLCVRSSQQNGTQMLLAPQVALLQPQQDLVLEAAEAATCVYLTFGITQTKRKHIGSGHAAAFADQVPPQASPEAAWGISMPTLVPAGRCDSALAMLWRCSGLWWQGALSRVKAQNILEGWLIDWALDLHNKSDKGNNSTESTTPDDDWLQRITAISREQLAHGIRTPDLAKAMGLSRQQLTEQCERRIGITPGEFLRRMRLEEATRMLDHTQDTIETIAKHCGYRSDRAFANAFKRCMGCSPSHYRKSKYNS